MEDLDLNEVIIDTAVHLELYKEYIIEELETCDDFLTFSEWREKNSEVLS